MTEQFLYNRITDKSPKINVWWSFPAVESFALSALGYLSIFKDLDLNPDLFVERIYYDTKNPLTPYKDVDCMGFSSCFELDILNIIKMLQKYNFPLKSNERSEDDPIIFCGGPVMMTNPFPYEEFFDFIVIGEKIVLKEVFEVLKNKRETPREEILKKLSKIEGIYTPKYPNEKIKIVRDNFEDEVLSTPILSDKSFFKDTYVIEIERGCPKMCNFCMASWLNMPVRFHTFEKIKNSIDEGLKYTNKIALLGAYVAGHPNFNEIISYISAKIDEGFDIELSISSLRADLADKNLIETLVKCHQKTATIALEAGSERLRKFIKKDLTNSQFIETLENMKHYGLKGAKIYVIIGLPTETQDDIEELIFLMKEVKEKLKTFKGSFNITISASTFVPKPNTPFENTQRLDDKTLKERINYLKKNFHKLGIEFRPPSIEWDNVQEILSRYEKSLSDFLIEVVNNGGNLGAFKQLWRKQNKCKSENGIEGQNYNKNKNGLSPLEKRDKNPLNNIKTLNFRWDIIDSGSLELKKKVQNSLSSCIVITN